MGRHLRTRWDLLKPNLSHTIRHSQEKQKERHDRHARLRCFDIGQPVIVKNFGSGASWVVGVIVQRLGPVTYLVDVSGGRVWRRHIDLLKERSPSPGSAIVTPDIDVDIDVLSPSRPTNSDETTTPEAPTEPPIDSTSDDSNEVTNPTGPSPTPQTSVDTPKTTETPPPRYPSRAHRPPERYGT